MLNNNTICNRRFWAITCFEYCYLLNLESNNQPVEMLYFSSFFSLGYLCKEMIATKKFMQNYDDIGRLQHVGNRIGYLRFREKNMDFEQMVDYCREVAEFPLVVKIIPKAFDFYNVNNTYLKMNNNHLVLLKSITDKKVVFYDTFLKREVIVSVETFRCGYDNRFYHIYDTRNDNETLQFFVNRCLGEWKLHVEMCIVNDGSFLEKQICMLLEDADNAIYIREAILLSKILNNRAIAFISFIDKYLVEVDLNGLIDLLQDKLTLLNKLYFKFEYHRRKKVYLNELCNIMEDIATKEKSIYKLLSIIVHKF